MGKLRTKRTRKKDERFFAALSEGLPVRAALDRSGYGRTAVYQWRREDPEFARRWECAIDDAVEAMEAEADRRAMEGTEKPVFYQGAKCGTIREYSDTLLIFRLKALKPEKYRDRFEHQVDMKIDLVDRLKQARERAAGTWSPLESPAPLPTEDG